MPSCNETIMSYAIMFSCHHLIVLSPLGHVIVPDMLRRQLKLDATGSVWLQTGAVDIVIPRKICIYPISKVVSIFVATSQSNKSHLKKIIPNMKATVFLQWGGFSY